MNIEYFNEIYFVVSVLNPLFFGIWSSNQDDIEDKNKEEELIIYYLLNIYLQFPQENKKHIQKMKYNNICYLFS